MNTARYQLSGAGTQTAALAMGGQTAPGARVGNTESWDGSSWTETTDLNTSRDNASGGGASNTSSLLFGGQTTTAVANTESWNGSSWTELNDLSTARSYIQGSGIASNAIASAGSPTPTNQATEEWTVNLGNKTITAS